uniref:Variant surface glycoprotein 1125.160 n=1 Tax=Trypanosoma brucei TaxID=5691 RepID=A0A1J0R5D0_9TRYP|nr:variant surface glycoprotein 1125.160 [Trypanosoma brucei]
MERMQKLKAQWPTASAIKTVLAFFIAIPIDDAIAATTAKGALHHTNLGNLCDLAANLANAADSIKAKLGEVRTEINKEQKISQTAFVAAGERKPPNATVEFTTALIGLKMAKVRETLLTTAEQASTAALKAGIAAGAVKEIFAVLEQLTKDAGTSSTAQSVCLINGDNSNGQTGTGIKATNPGNLAKCFTLGGGAAGSEEDPFSVRSKLSATVTGDDLFTAAAAAQGNAGCALTNIDTDSFGKTGASITSLNLAGGIIQLATTGGNNHQQSAIIAHTTVQAGAPDLHNAITAYKTVMQTIQTNLLGEIKKLAEETWKTAKNDPDIKKAFIASGLATPETEELPESLEATYKDYLAGRAKWSQGIEDGDLQNAFTKTAYAQQKRQKDLLQLAAKQEKCLTGTTGDDTKKKECNKHHDNQTNSEKLQCTYDENAADGKKCKPKPGTENTAAEAGEAAATGCAKHGTDKKACENDKTCDKQNCAFRKDKDNEDDKDTEKFRNGSFLVNKKLALISSTFKRLVTL